MELYKEMLVHILLNKTIAIKYSPMLYEVLNSTCYKLLVEIRQIIADDSVEDHSCFWRIEKIVKLFEENGIDCGSRHDF